MAYSNRQKYTLITAAAVVLAIALVLLFLWFNALRKQKQLKQRCETTLANIVSMKRDVGGRSEEDLGKLEDHLRLNRAQFNASLTSRQRADLIKPPPNRMPSSAELYFNMLEQNRQLQALAERYKVKLTSGDRFGFSDLTREGRIEDNMISSLRKQLQESYILCQLLFECSEGEMEFVSLARESVLPKDLNLSPHDLFDAREYSTLRTILGMETRLYKLTFRCYTDAFRRFMNIFEELLLPVVPRYVQMEMETPKPHADENNRWLLLTPKLSQFTVFLEWVDLMPVSAADNPSSKE